MSERILSRLEPVRRRQLGREMLRFAAAGLLAGSVVAIGLGVLRTWQKSSRTHSTLLAAALAFVLAGPALGAAAALTRGRSARLAAAAVDDHDTPA